MYSLMSKCCPSENQKGLYCLISSLDAFERYRGYFYCRRRRQNERKNEREKVVVSGDVKKRLVCHEAGFFHQQESGGPCLFDASYGIC